MVRKEPAAWSVWGMVQVVPPGSVEDPTNQPGATWGWVGCSVLPTVSAAACHMQRALPGGRHEASRGCQSLATYQQPRGRAHVLDRGGWEFLRTVQGSSINKGASSASSKTPRSQVLWHGVVCMFTTSLQPSAVACCGVNSHSMPCYAVLWQPRIGAWQSLKCMCTIGRAAAVVECSSCARLICAAWWQTGVCCRGG